MTTQCTTGTSFRLQSGASSSISSTANTNDVCTATKILDRLHKEFTEQYIDTPATGPVPTGKTVITDSAVTNNPSFYLRNQPSRAGFQGENAGSTTNRFYRMLNASKTEDDQDYRSAIYAIMNGVYKPNVDKTSYLDAPASKPTDFTSPSSFKGIYGLFHLNDVLESKIADTVSGMKGSEDTAQQTSDIATKYTQRLGIQTTLKEIARRENELYREKFLNIILILVGIFLVGSQLVQKYFSFGGNGGGGGGFSFGSGGLFTGFGLGSGSGLFSRFGGLGLGRSGRSRVTGSLFSNNPYSLSTR